MGQRRQRVGPVTVRKPDGTVEVVKASRFKSPRSSPEWFAIRRRVLERDDYRCKVCRRERGDEDPRLKRGTVRIEVHHLTYVRFGHERLGDLVTLCQRCHATEHQWQRRRAA